MLALAASPARAEAREFQRTSRPALEVRGGLGFPTAQTGETLILSSVTSIGGRRRNGFAAIDLRTGRPTAFNPDVPRRQKLVAMTASPRAMYLAYESFDEAPVGPKEIHAYDLRTGALLPAFDPPDFRDGGILGGMVYAGGRVIIGGAPPVGAGITLGAYDATTGARAWRAPIDWPVRSLATDGTRVFTEVPVEIEGPHLVTAFSAADGSPIAGWGSALTPRGYRAPLNGADARHVYSVSGRFRSQVRPFVVGARDGRPVTFPRLPSKVPALGPGVGGTMVGQYWWSRDRLVDAVLARSGRLIGTVPRRYRLLAQRDTRRLLAFDDARSRVVELMRPRR